MLITRKRKSATDATAATWSSSPQELDPISRMTAYKFSVAVGAASIGTAFAQTFVQNASSQITTHLLAALSIVILTVAWLSFIFMAHPRRTVITQARFQLVYALIIVAAILSAWSQAGSNHTARDDWGPIVLGLALMASAPYLSSIEAFWFTLQGAIVTVALALFQSVTSETALVSSILIVIALVPVVGFGLSAAAYSRSLVSDLRQLQASEAQTHAAHEDQVRQRLRYVSTVGELGALRTEVLPFLERLGNQDTLKAADTARARELAEDIRGAILERLTYEPLSELVPRFSDSDGAARSLNERQRAALRALILVVTNLDGIFRESFFLEFRPSSGEVSGSLTFNGSDPDGVRSTILPFVSMLGFVFGATEITSTGQTTIVSFSACHD